MLKILFERSVVIWLFFVVVYIFYLVKNDNDIDARGMIALIAAFIVAGGNTVGFLCGKKMYWRAPLNAGESPLLRLFIFLLSLIVWAKVMQFYSM